MKVLITGNLGYVGPGVIREFRSHYPDAQLLGFDTGYFAKYFTTTSLTAESFLDAQYFGDVRNFPERILEGVDTVVSLAAISNDPIGNKFEKVTLEVNNQANTSLAALAKKHGVKNFVFASSCSVYGAAEDAPRTEQSELNPLTAYARSKVRSEEELASLADDTFKVTCLRFATACGMSERLRLDLVLNDFVAGAITSGEITILSDGSPWRPLINVLDMARAIRWGHERDKHNGGNYVVVNTGSNTWNYQVRDLAHEIQHLMPEVKVSINTNAAPDKRSYRVNFDMFKALAPNHQPVFGLKETIQDLIKGLREIEFQDANFRKSTLIRLNVINRLLETGEVDAELKVVPPVATIPA